MLVTHSRRVSWPFLLLANLPFALWMFYLQLGQATGPFTLKRFTDDPSYVTILLILLRLPDLFIGPAFSYWSDNISTKWGKRVPFIAVASLVGGIVACIVPFMRSSAGVIVCLLLLQAAIAIGQAYQTLSQELTPLHQRGRSSGLRSLMFQLALIAFFSITIGRFDDVYRFGVLANIIPFTGEMMTYFVGGLAMILTSILVGLGVVERTSDYESARATNSIKRNHLKNPFTRRLLLEPIRFFKSLCSLELLASYLTIIVLSCNVEMMAFNYLLYTEQWGYSKQAMGGNIALGILIMIPFTFFAGVLLDKINAAIALFWTMILVFSANLLYILFVNVWMDGQRPSLNQILVFGEITSVLKWISITICWSLMFQFVPRNKMGAATAGINIFAAICVILSSGLLGNWITWFSKHFSPPAGIEMHFVMDSAVSESVMKKAIPGRYFVQKITGSNSLQEEGSQWLVRAPNEDVRRILSEKKDFENKLAHAPNSRDREDAKMSISILENQLANYINSERKEMEKILGTSFNLLYQKKVYVTNAEAADASYNYFSGYYMVMLGGALGALFAGLIVILERKGVFARAKEVSESKIL